MSRSSAFNLSLMSMIILSSVVAHAGNHISTSQSLAFEDEGVESVAPTLADLERERDALLADVRELEISSMYQLLQLHADRPSLVAKELFTPRMRELYIRAAESNLSQAQFNLGMMHELGLGGPVDYEEARRLYTLSAKQGNANGQTNLGYMYQLGLGGPVDYEEARRLYTLSADQGNAAGQNNLGVMHECGFGGPVNYEEARRLYTLSADQGNASAQENLRNLNELLNRLGLVLTEPGSIKLKRE